MSDKTKLGIYNKFYVERVDGSSTMGGKHDGCDYFVLDITHDPHAQAAIAAYASSCAAKFPQLASDLRAKITVGATPTDAALTTARNDALREAVKEVASCSAGNPEGALGDETLLYAVSRLQALITREAQ